jgi:hypothetical protein
MRVQGGVRRGRSHAKWADQLDHNTHDDVLPRAYQGQKRGQGVTGGSLRSRSSSGVSSMIVMLINAKLDRRRLQRTGAMAEQMSLVTIFFAKDLKQPPADVASGDVASNDVASDV